METTMGNTMNKIIVLLILLSTLMFTGCSSQNIKKTGKDDGTKNGTIDSSSSKVITSEVKGDNFNYYPGTKNDANDISLAGLSDANNPLSQRIIYFDYDKAAIRPEYMVLINTHAKLLAKYPNLKMRLEGHADERGSREYNVALSEARSQSVKSIMGLQGALGKQMRTIGYGEELPIVRGHSQDSWQQNRRVEIKYDDY